jgi:hypothetical protein
VWGRMEPVGLVQRGRGGVARHGRLGSFFQERGNSVVVEALLKYSRARVRVSVSDLDQIKALFCMPPIP